MQQSVLCQLSNNQVYHVLGVNICQICGTLEHYILNQNEIDKKN